MLRNRDMICFSHDWSSDPLSKTHLMRLLARDNRVLWVNSIGYRSPNATLYDTTRAIKKLRACAAGLTQPIPNLFVLSPLIIPSYSNATVQSWNTWLLRQQVQRAMNTLNFKRPVNWTFNPAAALIGGTLNEDLLIYYCVDEYSAFSGVSSHAMAELERSLLNNSDLVITSSERLHECKRRLCANTVLVRHGVEWEHFRAALHPQTKIPADIASLPKPVLGYFGLIARDWVDLDLIRYVARQMPHASIAMIGKSTTDLSSLKGLPNIHVLGHRPYSSLPAYCKGFDAALIPFPISEVTLNANPLKAREYLAAGLPVISTAIPEVQSLSDCRIGGTHDEFVSQVREALASPGPSVTRSDSIRHESWDARLAEISGHIDKLVSQRSTLTLTTVANKLAA